MQISRSTTVAAVGIASAVSIFGALDAHAQVVINMPPPPRKQAEAPPPSAEPPAAPEYVAPSSTPRATYALSNAAYPVSTVAPDVGDVALYRFAAARRGTYDTYFNDGTYWNNGIHYVSYPNYIPQFVWGPWGGFGWWGSGFWPGRCW